MVHSMTGFGRSVKENGNYHVTVEMRSVNHRFSEISIRMPRHLLSVEDKLKKIVQQHIRRGRVELYITIKGESLVQRSLRVDWPLVEQYIKSLSVMKEKYHLTDPIKLDHIIGQSEIFDIQEENSENDELEQLLVEAVEKATIDLLEMRKREGEQLKHDLLVRLKEMNELTIHIEDQAPQVVKGFEERIQKRITEFLTGNIDENRILTEAAIFADKADITEELTRLKSHIHQFEETLEIREPIGRKLDFIVQEMNREANTIGAKGNDHLIAKYVVNLKSMIEKIKEQVQNIE
ncbi:YicC/YloC family endoribonuclease [Bacillus sp. FJAT-47783]|uniref:YicC/YloC family endoribonuclease n=1 Tax=Bacillus sp. FJAT-47783 TaxID=2922712 RepID=UPI001FAE1023|nr:YicC/YloC family endoribonuclease [Bacillus sp. FJAT-47783]